MSGDTAVRLDQLVAQYDHEVVADPRAAAETAYALAFRYRNHDVDGERRFDLAKRWAHRSIQILDSLPSDQLEDVVSTRPFVEGVPIPELFHSGTVKTRLADVLV